MNNLSQNQQTQLTELSREAAEARQRAVKKVTDFYSKSRLKEIVTPEEYQSRLARSVKKDLVIVRESKEERIVRSLKVWKEKVGPTFAGATTDNPVILDRVSRLQTRTGKHKTSLVLYGNLGTGKSWTAHAYINLAISAGAVTAGQIISDTETAVLGKISSGGYKRVDMLDQLFHDRNQIYFIDDVGQGYFSNEQGRTEVWFELIDHVYTHQLTLIMTTNKAFTDFSLGRWIGARSFDRLKTLIGSDGLMEPGKVNRREGVLAEQEKRYRS